MIFFIFRRSILPVILALLAASGFCSSLQAAIRYEVSLAHPEQHLFHVVMTIPDVTGQVQVQMPAWNALYQIRDFSSHIQRVEAQQTASSTAAEAVQRSIAAIEKIDKQTWRITADGTVTIRYAIYWDEAGPFASQLNPEHAFINPAMILMYVPERRSEPVKFTLEEVPDAWQAAGPGIQTHEQMGKARRFISKFENYDGLADAPIEAGKFEEFQLEGLNPEVWVIVHGDNWKKRQVENDLKRICQYEIKLMGNAPYPRYTFIFHIGKGAAGGGGGMEHADSTAISIPSGEYLPGIAAHEFFHLWNVKRIHPASLYPVDYAKEQYTRALWFAEGVTNTYASYTLERSGLWTRQQFYHDLGKQITEVEARPANRWQSAEQSSLDAWLEKYPLYVRPENSVSYYTKGQILGTLLDILLRDRTDDGHSLDDVLRSMNADFGMTGKSYRDTLDIRLAAEKLAGSSFEEFFTRYVAAAEPLPYRDTLALAGLDLRESVHKRPALGFSTEPAAGGSLLVGTVDANGPTAAAGLQTGDLVVKWDGADPPRRPGEWLRQQSAGKPVRLRIRREQNEVTIDFRLGEITETYFEVVEAAHPSEKARRIREGLLRGITTPAAMRAAH